MKKELTFGTFSWIISLYCAFFIAVAFISPFFGAEKIRLSIIGGLFSGGNLNGAESQIFFQQRIPRVILGLVTGGGLALCGAVFQNIFRNPLAEPYTLGVTGGAVIFAALSITIPGLWISWGPFSTVQIFSLAGAFGSLIILYRFSKTHTGISVNTLLLAGIAINILSSGAILLFRYLMNPHLMIEIDRWLMGGIDVIGYDFLPIVFLLMLPSAGVLLTLAGELNALTLGEEMATGYGVNVRAVHLKAFIAGGILTAAIVSIAGPIGFVGLIIPHIVRGISGGDNRIVLPASFLVGGAFLAACDAFARTIIAPTEMPVGIITAVIGAPVFIRLLFRKY